MASEDSLPYRLVSTWLWMLNEKSNPELMASAARNLQRHFNTVEEAERYVEANMNKSAGNNKSS